MHTIRARKRAREASLKALLEVYPDIIHSSFPSPEFWDAESGEQQGNGRKTPSCAEQRVLEEAFAVCPWPSQAQMRALMPGMEMEALGTWFMRRCVDAYSNAYSKLFQIIPNHSKSFQIIPKRTMNVFDIGVGGTKNAYVGSDLRRPFWMLCERRRR